MKKRALLIMFIVISFSVVLATSSLTVLKPAGKTRVALTADGGGSATWNPEAPAVYTGSFSARLDTGEDPDEDGFAGGAGIMVGPESIRFSTFNSSTITFWMYAYSCADRTPYVDFVLDNGRTLEGTLSVPVNPADTVTSEIGQTYPSANLWVQMQPADGWYSSFALNDPLIPNSFASPQPLSAWQATFPGARVIQVKIQYGYGNQGPDAECIVFVDNARIKSRVIHIEPETFAGTVVPSTGKPFNP